MRHVIEHTIFYDNFILFEIFLEISVIYLGI